MLKKPHSQIQNQYKVLDIAQQIFESTHLLKQSQSQFFLNFTLLINYSNLFNLQIISTTQFILQFFQIQIKFGKIGNDCEQIQLAYITFLSKYCKKPLLSLVELRKYEIGNNQSSFYFDSIKNQINLQLEKLLIAIHKTSNNINLREQEKQSLDIVHINKSQILEETHLPKIITLLELKINYWQRLIKGYNNIQEFQNEAIQLSKQIQICQINLLTNLSFDIENLSHLGTNTNVIELKIASIFYSSIMNDYYNSAQCEFLISEIFNIEHTFPPDIITNLTLVDDRVALVMLSMVKNLGQIVNPNKGLAQYFGYDEKEFQSIQYIHQLMPPFISIIHNQLLQDYLQKAKSKLFESYNMMFSSDSNGFLIPQQLKIDHNFLNKDDYVIMGCLSQIKKGNDFILFGENGKLLGITESFYNLFQGNSKIPISRLLQKCYIYMLIPSIIRIIESYRDQWKNKSFTQTLEETTTLTIPLNIEEIFQLFQTTEIRSKSKTKQQSIKSLNQDENSSKQQHNSSSKKKKQSDKTYTSISIRFNYNNFSEFNSTQLKNVSLLNKENQEDIFLTLQKINDQEIEKYLIKFSMSFKSFGKGDYLQSYFILEIIDIRKKDILGKQSISTNLELNQSKFYSLQTNQNYQTDQLTIHTVSGFTQTEQPLSEIVPQQGQISQGVADIIKKLGIQKNHDFNLFNLDSFRDSLSYGPLSQRANFISPDQKDINNEDIRKIDQDFNELGFQLNSASVMMQKQKAYDDDFELEDSLNKKEQQKSSSNKEQENKNEILQIMVANKLRDKNHQEEEVLKSKSSFTSGTSGTSAIQQLRQFQNIKSFTRGLKFITILSSFTFIILLVLVILHIVILKNEYESAQSQLNDINGPVSLNRIFLEVFSFSWTLTLTQFEIIQKSEYLQEQIKNDLKQISLTMHDDIANMFLGFIKVEEQGLLESQNYTYLDGSIITIHFPYFLDLIENSLFYVAKISQYSLDEISTFINQEYMDQLLLLRFNLIEMYQMTSELITSLNLILNNQSTSRVQSMQTQIIIEIICISILLIMELYYWKSIQNYCQSLMLLIGRQQESDTNDLIARATLIKEILKQQGGQFSWRKQNYYTLNYQQFNSFPFEKINTQSKILQQYSYEQGLTNKIKATQKNQEISSIKRSANVVLSARIYDTEYTILTYGLMLLLIYVILSMILLGGFLLFQQQTNDLAPSLKSKANYLKYLGKLDTIMTTASISKTQQLLYNKLIEVEIYDSQTLNSYYQTKDVVELFYQLNEDYDDEITDIYDGIASSTKIEQNDKEFLFKLYESSFCSTMEDVIPMCNPNNLDFDQFSQIYGEPSLPLDNNTEFLSTGIVGVNGRLDALNSQDFYYESEELDYEPDIQLLEEQISQQNFRSAIFQHFLDTNDGTNKFSDLLQEITIQIMQDDLIVIYIYYGVFGSVCLVSYLIFYIILITKTNTKLIRIRLALVTLPISILTEQHTLSMLKRLN